VGRRPRCGGTGCRPPQHRHGSLDTTAAVLAGGRAPPGYAPELNPVEGLWSNLKALELANLTGPTLAEVIAQAHLGIERVRQTPHLAYSFLRHTGLSVS
jgi:transposase